MTVTITLKDPLASQLQSQAEAQRLSVEELALRLLGEAVNGFPALQEPVWNQRRLELIQRSFAGGLSEEEEEELHRLQVTADQHLEALDRQRLDQVKQLREQVQQSIAHPEE